jgi:ABC-type nitrate/sulfonate/bicarbonate transport system ATPase subunit
MSWVTSSTLRQRSRATRASKSCSLMRVMASTAENGSSINSTRIKLQDLLARVARERCLSVLLVTHDIDEAVHLSDRIVLLDRQPGPPRAQLPVAAARPRARGDAAARLKAQILAMLDLETA